MEARVVGNGSLRRVIYCGTLDFHLGCKPRAAECRLEPRRLPSCVRAAPGCLPLPSVSVPFSYHPAAAQIFEAVPGALDFSSAYKHGINWLPDTRVADVTTAQAAPYGATLTLSSIDRTDLRAADFTADAVAAAPFYLGARLPDVRGVPNAWLYASYRAHSPSGGDALYLTEATQNWDGYSFYDTDTGVTQASINTVGAWDRNCNAPRRRARVPLPQGVYAVDPWQAGKVWLCIQRLRCVDCCCCGVRTCCSHATCIIYRLPLYVVPYMQAHQRCTTRRPSAPTSLTLTWTRSCALWCTNGSATLPLPRLPPCLAWSLQATSGWWSSSPPPRSS